jgi:hypothetical protein
MKRLAGLLLLFVTLFGIGSGSSNEEGRQRPAARESEKANHANLEAETLSTWVDTG